MPVSILQNSMPQSGLFLWCRRISKKSLNYKLLWASLFQPKNKCLTGFLSGRTFQKVTVCILMRMSNFSCAIPRQWEVQERFYRVDLFKIIVFHGVLIYGLFTSYSLIKIGEIYLFLKLLESQSWHIHYIVGCRSNIFVQRIHCF